MPLLYDRDCGFCRFSVAVVLAWDRRGRLRPVAIQSDEGQQLLAALPEADRLASAHVVEPDGALRSGAVRRRRRRVQAGPPAGSALARSRDLVYPNGRRARRRGLGRLLPSVRSDGRTQMAEELTYAPPDRGSS